MTRKEAIEELERLLRHWDDLENDKRCFWGYDKEAVALALSTLRPVSREALKPCSRCRPQENSLDRFSGHEFLIDDAEIYFYDSEDGWEGEEIRFCPWCGRPLTEAAWAELEKRVRGI